MILLDKPYVSEFLRNTLIEQQIPVIDTFDNDFSIPRDGLNLVSEKDAVEMFKNDPSQLLLTNSENSISWTERNLPFTDLPKKINQFKNKVAFRSLISDIYPNFYFKAVKYQDLDKVDINTLPMPFIVKPAVGFFSIGVYKVDSTEEWPGILEEIKNEIENTSELFPKEVLDISEFTIEEYIDGEEYAIDCYFNSDGKPVILNILKHLFASGKDVSDRVYITSKEILQSTLKPVEDFLASVGALTDLRNFPIHVEIRIDKSEKLHAIEFNPMRFGGWCTTADMAYHSFGFNSYMHYLNQEEPNWKVILDNFSDSVYSIIVLDNNSGISDEKIKSFDYQALLNDFSKPIELRKIDYKQYPLFGFLFAETNRSDISELENILQSDLTKYITT